MGVRILNRIFVLPTEETLEILKDHFQAAPFDIYWDQLCVEIGSTPYKIDLAEPETIYAATTGSMGLWYDTATALNSLILPLFPSQEMANRNKEIGDGWGRKFLPYLRIRETMVNGRKVKAFCNSVATGFVDYPQILTFHIETSIVDNSVVAPDHGFYQDYLARGQIDNQVFLAQDEGIE